MSPVYQYRARRQVSTSVRRIIQKLGGSFYVCLPKIIVTEKMLMNGVTLTVVDYNEESATIYVKAQEASKFARPLGKQRKIDTKSGENA